MAAPALTSAFWFVRSHFDFSLPTSASSGASSAGIENRTHRSVAPSGLSVYSFAKTLHPKARPPWAYFFRGLRGCEDEVGTDESEVRTQKPECRSESCQAPKACIRSRKLSIPGLDALGLLLSRPSWL